MAAHVLSILNEQFTPTVIDRLSSDLNESAAGTRKAVDGVIPTLLGALTQRVQHTGGASAMISFLDKGNYQNTPFDVGQVTDKEVTTGQSTDAGREFVAKIFDDRLDQTVGLISTYSGIRPTSVSTLMQLAGTILMGILGRQEQDKGLSAENLETLLLGQATEFRKAVPGGLGGVSSLLGFDELVTPAGPQTEVQGTDNFSGTILNPNIPKSTEGERRHENVRWLRWAAILIAILVVALIVQKCRQPQNSIDGVNTDTTKRVESNAVEDRSAATRNNVEESNGQVIESNGQVIDSTAPGALGIRDSTGNR